MKVKDRIIAASLDALPFHASDSLLFQVHCFFVIFLRNLRLFSYLNATTSKKKKLRKKMTSKKIKSKVKFLAFNSKKQLFLKSINRKKVTAHANANKRNAENIENAF